MPNRGRFVGKDLTTTAPTPRLVEVVEPREGDGSAQPITTEDSPRRTTPQTEFSSVLSNGSQRVDTARDSGFGTIVSATSYGSMVSDGANYTSHSKLTPSRRSSSSLLRPMNQATDAHIPEDSIEGRCLESSQAHISMDIPSGSLFEDELLTRMAFSKRGSILLGGRRASNVQMLHEEFKSDPEVSQLVVQAQSTRDRQLSADEERLSQQVRSMYEYPNGVDMVRQDPALGRALSEDAEESSSSDFLSAGSFPMAYLRQLRPGSEGTRTPSASRGSATTAMQEEDHHGGLEDWEDVDGGGVDRYGFILTRALPTKLSSSNSNRSHHTYEPQRPQRVSTLLQLASETPRRNRAVRKVGSPRPVDTVTPQVKTRPLSKRLDPEMSSPPSDRSGGLRRVLPISPFRSVANRFQGRRHQRFLAEAGDMLTQPPSRLHLAEDGKAVKGGPSRKDKEGIRADKWWKMAQVLAHRTDGGGMVFDFDVHDPKLISRTWKGIPDRWRASAWHAFLSDSASKHEGSLSDEDIVINFHVGGTDVKCNQEATNRTSGWVESEVDMLIQDLLSRSSADDVQIDLDVPRTINRHVLFRRRYRGGQRLLFRLLHALSLYFPEAGYVQGMASLAATLLCYYDEDTAFVMLVRMWQLRGLERLYQAGFNGLIQALGEFEHSWLSDSSVAAKLNDLGIDATAYGTRWYLTLFNYSIPFPAQLRVWDVFMLLGDASSSSSTSIKPTVSKSSSSLLPSGNDPSNSVSPSSMTTTPTTTSTSNGVFDILHATSAALIDGMRDILLASDFENAMKVLTSWVPIMDEDLFMRVVKAEWNQRCRGR